MHPEQRSLCAGPARAGHSRTRATLLCGCNLLKRLPRVLVPLAAAVALVACSTPAPKEKAVPEHKIKVKQDTVRPARVDIQQDATGFTILQDVRVSTDVHAQYENAVRLLEAQQHEQGIAALVRVAEGAPNVTAIHIDLGIAYARSGELDRAEESLKKALQLNPRHPIAHN